MADEVTLLPEERLEQLSDSLITSMIRDDELALKNRQILFGQLPPKVFKDENNYIKKKNLYFIILRIKV